MGSDFKIFLDVLLAIAAGIVAVGGAVGVIEHLTERISMKSNKVAEAVSGHDETLKKHAEYLDNDNKRLKEIESSNKLIMRGLMQLMTHEIDGNHVDKLEEARNDINRYLIER